ncbi:dihydroneopterin aldolase family protein [Natrarchaeobius chitinivorans]|uniref:Dihydroneopterin aldolase n=1 Tax=Natrarchaeobius chitinivorans TaxID=1679083 RepID=A0A3N6M5X1_NATCH|nr:dihydroneopterin aldolase family protein [Natrarchaeobius chitinivorans]RQG90701.1 hypothetical protein EA473_20550 [Natrarchaeobius chitinivorans]
MTDETEATDATTPTTAEAACFEAGIKFGSLYHQFAGTPLSLESAASIETAIEEAIENQPHCTDVTVTVQRDALEAELAEATAEYTELTGRFLEVEIVLEYDGCEVHTRMAMEDGYPLMRLEEVRGR